MSLRSEIDKENKALRTRMNHGTTIDDRRTVAALVAIYERLGDIETLLAETQEA